MTREMTVPYNLPAERAVLGGLLQDAAFADVADPSLAADFYLQKHTIVYAAIRECQQRGVAVDIITVADVLKRRDELDMVGGMSFLAELMQEAAATSWHFNDHASVISRTATQRRAIEATGAAQAAIYNFAGEDPAKLAEHVLKIVSAPFQRVQARKRRLWLTEDEIDALPPVEFAIDGVIVKSGVTLIYGASDSGKTFLVVDMAKRYAHAQAKRVMYCAGEDANGIAARKKAWDQEYQREPNGNFLMWTKRISFLNDEEVKTFIEQMQAANVGMVVIDTLSQFAGGNDENANELMALFVANCERIRIAIDGPVILVHHTDKGGNNFRGAGALKDNTYGCLSVYKDDDVIVMECIRIKNFRPWVPRRFRLKEVKIIIGGVEAISCIPLPASQIKANKDVLSPAQSMILNGACIIAKVQGAAKATDLKPYVRVEERNFWTSLNRLIKDGFIYRSSERGASGFVPTEQGWAYSREQYKAAVGDGETGMFGVTTTEGIDIIEIPRYNSIEGYDTPSEPQEPVTGATVRLGPEAPTTQHLNELRAEWARLDTAIDQGYAKLSEDDAMVYNELQEGLETLLAGSEEYEALATRFNEYAAIDNALGRVLAMQIRWGQIGQQLQEASHG